VDETPKPTVAEIMKMPLSVLAGERPEEKEQVADTGGHGASAAISSHDTAPVLRPLVTGSIENHSHERQTIEFQARVPRDALSVSIHRADCTCM